MDSVTEPSIEFAWKLNSGGWNLPAATAVVPFVMSIRTILIPNLDSFDGERNVLLIQSTIRFYLKNYGVRGMPFNWFRSYLTNRKQYVEVNGASSDVLDVMCGVPQGSVLGPLLFLIFINDLPAVCKKLKFYLFADDTNIYFESDSLDLLEKTMNKELKKVDKWLTTNRLALNVDKSHFPLFHSSSNIPHRKIRIKIRNKRITEENDVKFLGVLLDSTLSWKPHRLHSELETSHN